MLRLFHSIINRMYCEYYKLCKIIIEYICKNISDKKLLEIANMNANLPVYKDLEPFKQYEFQFITGLEIAPTWNHIDCRNFNKKANNNKSLTFQK